MWISVYPRPARLQRDPSMCAAAFTGPKMVSRLVVEWSFCKAPLRTRVKVKPVGLFDYHSVTTSIRIGYVPVPSLEFRTPDKSSDFGQPKPIY